jgi:hypothetical protein
VRVQQQVAKVLLADRIAKRQSVFAGLPTLSLDTPAPPVPLNSTLWRRPIRTILSRSSFTSGTTAEPAVFA